MPKRDGPGRPNKLTEHTKKRLLDAIRAGNTFDAACRYARINFQTFRNWQFKGEQGLEVLENRANGKTDTRRVYPEYVEFLEELKDAEADAEVNLVSKINKCGDKDWRACAFILERRHGDEWGPREKIESNIQEKVTITFEDVGPRDPNDNRTRQRPKKKRKNHTD